MRDKLETIKKCIDQKLLDSAKKLLIQDLKSKIDSSILAKESEARGKIHLAHYTSIGTIYSILSNQKKYNEEKQEYNVVNLETYLRAYDAISVNDPNEGSHLKNEFMKENRWIADATEVTDVFVCSFVSDDQEVCDKLTYWQSYGIDGLGCSIQLASDYQGKLKRVLYGNEAQHVKEKFKNYLELGGELYNKFTQQEEKRRFATDFWKTFDEIKFLYKHAAYKDEKEYRYVKIIEAEKDIKYHFKEEGPYLRRYILVEDLSANNILTSGSKVVIGPRIPHHDSLLRQLRKLAEQADLWGPSFERSKIPYRKVW